MNRKGFLRSLFVVSAAPKVLLELGSLQTKNIVTSFTPIDQNFFNIAFSGKVDNNRIYKECYNIDIVSGSGMSEWLTEFGNQQF